MVYPIPTPDQFRAYARYLYGITPKGKETVAALEWAGIFPALNQLFNLEAGWSFTWKLAEIAMLCELTAHFLENENARAA